MHIYSDKTFAKKKLKVLVLFLNQNLFCWDKKFIVEV